MRSSTDSLLSLTRQLATQNMCSTCLPHSPLPLWSIGPPRSVCALPADRPIAATGCCRQTAQPPTCRIPTSQAQPGAGPLLPRHIPDKWTTGAAADRQGRSGAVGAAGPADPVLGRAGAGSHLGGQWGDGSGWPLPPLSPSVTIWTRGVWPGWTSASSIPTHWSQDRRVYWCQVGRSGPRATCTYATSRPAARGWRGVPPSLDSLLHLSGLPATRSKAKEPSLLLSALPVPRPPRSCRGLQHRRQARRRTHEHGSTCARRAPPGWHRAGTA